MRDLSGDHWNQGSFSDTVSDSRSRSWPHMPVYSVLESCLQDQWCFGRRAGSYLRGLRNQGTRWSQEVSVRAGAGGAALLQIHRKPRGSPSARELCFACGTDNITGQHFSR